MLVRVVLIERVTCGKRLEEVEKASHVAFWGKALQPERAVCTKALSEKVLGVFEEQQESVRLEQEGQGWEMKTERYGGEQGRGA